MPSSSPQGLLKIGLMRERMEYQGISLTPYVRASFGGGFTIRANFYTYYVGANPNYRKVTIMPEIGIFYSFRL
jgi:hypothetical protein